MKKAFITGLTGFLGSFIGAALLERGYELIILARGSKTRSVEERVEECLGFVNPRLLEQGNFTVVEGDVSLANFGLPPDEYSDLVNAGIDEIWHIAGSISFSDKERSKTFAINVGGANNILILASLIKPREVHYLSTAFVCGDFKGNFPENELDCGQRFYNPYEASKFESEGLVRSWAAKNPNVKTFIYRPSIVVGDSITGKTLGYSGYYTYMRAYHVVKKSFLNGRAKEVPTDEVGRIVLPISVPGLETSSLNIITVDYAISTIMALKEKGFPGVYHITAGQPETYGYWLEEGTKFLGLTGIKTLTLKEGDYKGNGPIEERLWRGVADYRPYITYQPSFDKGNVKKALALAYHDQAVVTPELIAVLLDYAVRRDFK